MKNPSDKRRIFGWAMYDWANSAFVTTVTVGVLPIYFADVVVGPEGFQIGGTVFRASTLWGVMISAAALFTFLFAPVLGAIADFSAKKKKFLMAFCYGGSLFGLLLYFCGSGDVYATMLFFVLAQIGFVGGNIFYDAFLPHLADKDTIDWVSGKGYAYGYAGGGLQFALSLGIVAGHDYLGITEEHAARIAIAMASLWWAGFSLFTLFLLDEPGTAGEMPAKYRNTFTPVAHVRIGMARIYKTLARAARFRHLGLFLIAYMIYNDGIQTVINMATIYGRVELKLSATVLMLVLLVIQVVAFLGALLFGKLGGRISGKYALMASLILWSLVVMYAYIMESAAEFFILGIAAGIVLGGSQALSRSLYGSMIPKESSAEFYGFYSVFDKFSAIWGPLVFSVIGQLTGSLRLSIFSLIGFFIGGLVLLWFVDVEKGKAPRDTVELR